MLSELPRDYAVVALAIACALAVVLFMYALGLRVANVLHSREQEQLRRTWWPVFAEVTILGDEGTLQTPKWPRHKSRVKLLREWCRFRSTIHGDCCRNLDQLALELGLLPVAQKLCRSRYIGHRLLAIQALGLLRDHSSWERIAESVKDSSVPIAITAASALVNIEPVSAIEIILPEIAKRNAWPKTQIGKILHAAGADVVTVPLCTAIKGADSDGAVRLLRFYEAAYIKDMDRTAEHLLVTSNDPAVIAAALKAVRGDLPRHLVERCVRHDTWFIRMQAANLLSKFGRREDYALLEPLLSDAEWWVRYRAAQAITKLPFLGPNALRKLRGRQKDKYAQQIMSQALAEVGL